MTWDQLRAIVWLRWRLTRNQFLRGGQLNAVLSVILLVLLLLAGAGFAVGGVLLGLFAGAHASPPVLLLIWDAAIFAFLIFWFSGLMMEIQRSESVDLTKLLHLPVTLHQVFVLNYAAAHFTPSIVVFLPAMLGLCAGMAVTGGAAFALLAPCILALIFLVTAWTYCLRGWLVALMVNKRRRRAILVWITLVFVLIAQTPNLIFNSRYFRDQTRSHRKTQKSSNDNALVLPDVVLEAHLALPPGWVGYSAMALKESNNPWPALGASAAGFLLGALGLLRAYRLTLRFYQGAEGGSGAPKPGEPIPDRGRPAARGVSAGAGQASAPRGILLVERRLPWLRDDIAGLTLATLRSLLRAPELKMALIMPIVMGVVMLSAFFTRSKGSVPESFRPFIATLAVTAAAFCLIPTMSNVFGLDRNGFRALVLLPTERRHILLAKNLAFFPLIAAVTLALLILVKFVVNLSWGSFLAGLMQAPAAFFLFSLLGNFVSIVAPYRLASGTLQAKKPKAIVLLAVFASFILLPLILLPILIPPAFQLLCSGLGWVPWLPVNLLATAGILAGTLWLYRGLLPLQGRLLQRREQTILREVTEEVE